MKTASQWILAAAAAFSLLAAWAPASAQDGPIRQRIKERLQQRAQQDGTAQRQQPALDPGQHEQGQELGAVAHQSNGQRLSPADRAVHPFHCLVEIVRHAIAMGLVNLEDCPGPSVHQRPAA